MDKKLTESKKGVGMLYGILACLVAGTAAAVAGPAGVAVLPYVIGGITTICGAHQISQGVQDTFHKGNPDVSPQSSEGKDT